MEQIPCALYCLRLVPPPPPPSAVPPPRSAGEELTPLLRRLDVELAALLQELGALRRHSL